MAYRTCDYCNSKVETDANFCPNCGAPLPALEAEPVVVPPAPTFSPTGYNTVTGGYEPVATEPTNTYYGSKPGILGSWKTSVGASVVGCLCSFLCNSSLEVSSGATSTTALIGALLIAIVFAVAGGVYALVFYPKYFQGEPRQVSSATVSFLNLFFGGIIFGCLWNHNLTRGERGISNIVFVVILGLSIILAILAMVGVFAYSGVYGSAI